MSESRLPYDVFAGLMLLAGLLLCLCVLGQDSGGPASSYPAASGPGNLLGPAGAWVAQVLLDTLGVSVHVLLAAWLVLVLTVFSRRQHWTWARRLTGWVLLVPTTALLADRWRLHFGPEPLIGPGGTLGAFLSVSLNSHFRATERALLLVAAVALCLVLTSGVLLVRAGRIAGIAFLWLLRRIPRVALRCIRRPRVALRSTRGSIPGKTDSLVLGTADTGPADPTNPVESAQLDSAAAGPPSIPIFHHDSLTGFSEPESPAFPSGEPRLARSLLRTPTPQSEAERFADYELPPLNLLEDSQPTVNTDQDRALRERATLLEKTFADFGISIRVVGINTGPVVTQFEIALQTGLRVHKVTSLADDVALNLKVAERPHGGANPRQEHRRHRGPQRETRRRPAQGCHSGLQQEDRQEQAAAVFGQGQRGPAAGL